MSGAVEIVRGAAHYQSLAAESWKARAEKAEALNKTLLAVIEPARQEIVQLRDDILICHCDLTADPITGKAVPDIATIEDLAKPEVDALDALVARIDAATAQAGGCGA